MQFIDLLLARLALVLYGLGIVLAFASMLARRPAWFRAVPFAALAGWILHGASLVRLWQISGEPPLSRAADRISLLAWAAVLFYLVAARAFRLEIVGVVILPLAVVLILISGYLPAEAVRVPEAIRPGLFWFHISVATLGAAALFLAFGASIVYLIQDRGLKAKRPFPALSRLPSLQRCDTAGHGALLWGFPLLTVAIISGAIWSANIKSSYWGALSQETLSLLAWAILGIVLYARLITGWRGRKAAYLTIVAFTAILLRMLA